MLSSSKPRGAFTDPLKPLFQFVYQSLELQWQKGAVWAILSQVFTYINPRKFT